MAEMASNLESLCDGGFCNMSDRDAVLLFAKAFGPELERLKRVPEPAESGSTEISGSNNDARARPSHLIFGQNFPEVNRTLVGLLALKWIMSDDYEAFTRYQPHAVKLHVQSFTKLRDLFSQCLQGPADTLALVTAIIINDLGKDPYMAGDITSLTGKPLPTSNHDMLVYDAAKVGMIPSLQRLDEPHKEDVMLGLRCGSGLNIAQLAQAESVPGNLQAALMLKGHHKAFDIKFLEVLLDVAGAHGHLDSRCQIEWSSFLFFSGAFLSDRLAALASLPVSTN